MKLKKHTVAWLVVILWCGFIHWMSSNAFSAQNTSTILEPLLRFLMPSISEAKIQVVHFVVRKMAHLTEYFIAGTLLFRAFRDESGNERVWRWACYSILIVVLIALSDEFHQSFLASRTASMKDVGIDTLGGIIAQGMNVAWWRHKRSATLPANPAP
jgi:VanZ family protein